jgi:hypothetical protein
LEETTPIDPSHSHISLQPAFDQTGSSFSQNLIETGPSEVALPDIKYGIFQAHNG